MFAIGDITYADAGNILVGNRKRGYQLTGTPDQFKEEPVMYSDMTLIGSTIKYNNGTLVEFVKPNITYAELKARFVKRRYSNDDQIAIMLNKDESDETLMKFQKMQEWRDWSGILAKEIIKTIKDE